MIGLGPWHRGCTFGSVWVQYMSVRLGVNRGKQNTIIPKRQTRRFVRLRRCCFQLIRKTTHYIMGTAHTYVWCCFGRGAVQTLVGPPLWVQRCATPQSNETQHFTVAFFPCFPSADYDPLKSLSLLATKEDVVKAVDLKAPSAWICQL